MASSSSVETTSTSAEEPSTITLFKPPPTTKARRQPRGPPADDSQPQFPKRERLLVEDCYVARTGIMAPTDIDPVFEQFLATSWRHPPSDQLLPSPSPSPDLPSTPPPLPSAPPPSPTYSSAFEEIAKLRSSATSRWASEVQEETFVYTPNEVEELVEPIKEDINTIAAPSPDRSTSSSRWATEVPSAPVPQTTNFSIKGLAARKAASSRTFSEDNNTETDWGDTSSELSLRTDDGDDRAITNDSSSVSLKGSRGCQTHRFRRPTSDASTLKPRKAQSKAQSSFTVDTRLSQAQSCYSSIERNLELDPISSYAGMRCEGDLATLDSLGMRTASGGPKPPKVPVEVIDHKIEHIRARDRRVLTDKLISQGRHPEWIQEQFEKRGHSKRDYALDRPASEAKKLATIEEYRARRIAEEPASDEAVSSSESEAEAEVGKEATPRKQRPTRSGSSSRSSGSEYETGWDGADLDKVSPPRSPISRCGPRIYGFKVHASSTLSSPQCDGWEKMPISKINGSVAVETGWGSENYSSGAHCSTTPEEEEEEEW